MGLSTTVGWPDEGDNPLLGVWIAVRLPPTLAQPARYGWPKPQKNWAYDFKPDGTFFHVIDNRWTGGPLDGRLLIEGSYRIDGTSAFISDCIETWKPVAYDSAGNVIARDVYVNPPYARKPQPEYEASYPFHLEGDQLIMSSPQLPSYRKACSYYRNKNR